MSGDHGLPTVIAGVLAACEKSIVPLKVYLCGHADGIKACLKEHSAIPSLNQQHCSLKIISCTDALLRTASPARFWKTAPQSSIIRCISLQQQGQVDASVSAGDTGILMSAAIFLIGRNKQYSRPALAALLPTITNRPVLVLDVGANTECRSEHLVDFARMGIDYLVRSGNKNPTVSLLNVGSESTKGPRAVREAAVALKQLDCAYSGFVEGSHVLAGKSDIVVCDGFTGNVLLKACGSFYKLVARVLEQPSGVTMGSVSGNPVAMSILNPDAYGAVPLLGINGIVLKAHGSSSSGAIANAVKAAVTLIQQNQTKS